MSYLNREKGGFATGNAGGALFPSYLRISRMRLDCEGKRVGTEGLSLIPAIWVDRGSQARSFPNSCPFWKLVRIWRLNVDTTTLNWQLRLGGDNTEGPLL